MIQRITDCSVDGMGPDIWRLTCMYREVQTHLRQKTWDVLKGLCGVSALPWVCIGDFNETI